MRTAALLVANLVFGTVGLVWLLVHFGRPALALLRGGVSPAWLAAFAAMVLLGFAGYALRWRILLDGLGAPRALARLTAFRAAGQSVSSLVPSAKLGGEPLRAWLLVEDDVPGAAAIASVAVDRTLEIASNVPFACAYAALLVRRGIPALEGALATVAIGAAAIVLGVAVAARRLRRRSGIVTAVARATGLARLAFVRARMDVLGDAEERAAALVGQPRRLGRAFATGLAVNVLVLLEYHCLLAAFGLPAGPVAVVAAIFAAAAAHSLPVPAAVGTLEGAEMFIFGTLGHPPAVGLAVGLACRLRESAWTAPGLVWLVVRGLRGALRRRQAP